MAGAGPEEPSAELIVIMRGGQGQSGGAFINGEQRR